MVRTRVRSINPRIRRGLQFVVSMTITHVLERQDLMVGLSKLERIMVKEGCDPLEFWLFTQLVFGMAFPNKLKWCRGKRHRIRGRY